MKKGFKLTAVMAGLLLVTAGSSGLFATCQVGVFPIFQCGFIGWFAPPPADAGSISAVWWQVGFGNNLVNTGVIGAAAQDGTGVTTGAFPGNDSGLSTPANPAKTNTGAFALTNAQAVLGNLYPGMIPAGALCADYENSWGGAGVDGCADNARTTSALDNDDILNPYWTLTYGPCPADDCPYETTSYLTDYPIAMLARTSSNKYFALAFVASINRNGNSADQSEGVFNVGAITTGDLNPIPGKGNNIIPWQPVPKPIINFAMGSDAGGPRTVNFYWNNIRIVHDGSVRNTGPRPAAAPVSGGVGVLNFLDGPGEDL